MHPDRSTCSSIVQSVVGAFDPASAGNQLRSPLSLAAGLGLSQFLSFGMATLEITCPFEVTGAYMPETSLTTCIWPTTHQAGIVTLFEFKFCRQILTLPELSLRSLYILAATTSLEKPCSLGSAITCTHLT